jgi:hypothetical protein
MLLPKEIYRHWLVPAALDKTNIFVVYVQQSLCLWGRERVGGTWANKLLKIKLTGCTQASGLTILGPKSYLKLYPKRDVC